LPVGTSPTGKNPILCDLCASVVKVNNLILFTYIIRRYLPQRVSEVLGNTCQLEARGVEPKGGTLRSTPY
jgi:hypothetical protein